MRSLVESACGKRSGSAAAVPGVAVLPDGDDPDLRPGQVRLVGNPLVEVPADSVLSDDGNGIAGLDAILEIWPKTPILPKQSFSLTSIIDAIERIATYDMHHCAIYDCNTPAWHSAKPDRWLSGQTSRVAPSLVV